jgi:hypothetical protein
MLRGCSYTATGTRPQLQQLAAKLVSQALGSAAFEPDPDIQQWWYLNEEVRTVLQADALNKPAKDGNSNMHIDGTVYVH